MVGRAKGIGFWFPEGIEPRTGARRTKIWKKIYWKASQGTNKYISMTEKQPV